MSTEYEQQQAWWDSMNPDQQDRHMREVLHMSDDEIRMARIESEACKATNARNIATRDEWSATYRAELAARGVIRENGYSRFAVTP